MARVLVVDNEPDISEAFQTFFELRGYAVRIASDGAAALHQIEAEPPDVMLLDIYLPGMNGLEILRMAKACAPGVSVIVVSACIDDLTREVALGLGAKACLRKPVSLHDLQSFVAYVIGKPPISSRWH